MKNFSAFQLQISSLRNIINDNIVLCDHTNVQPSGPTEQLPLCLGNSSSADPTGMILCAAYRLSSSAFTAEQIIARVPHWSNKRRLSTHSKVPLTLTRLTMDLIMHLMQAKHAALRIEINSLLSNPSNNC